MADFNAIFKKVLDASSDAMSKAADVAGKAANAAGKAIVKAADASSKAVTRAATTAVDTTRFKMDEMAIQRRRNDVLTELGTKLYDLSQSGTVLPEEAADIVARLQTIDIELETLRTEHNARTLEIAQQAAAEKAARAGVTVSDTEPVAEPTEDVSDNEEPVIDVQDAE